MTVPVFEEYEPALDCPCAGCAQRRHEAAQGLAVRQRGSGGRRALALAAAAGLAWGCGVTAATAAPAHIAGGTAPLGHAGAAGHAALTAAPPVTDGYAEPSPATPQGGSGPVHGKPGGGSADLPKTTRAQIISRAKTWVTAKVPYSMTKFWTDGYRQDCSGYVSMAWHLPKNEWTGSLARYGVKIARADLRPGDILLFHNPADPDKGSHVTIFGGWADASHRTYLAYEQTPPHTRAQVTPMAYWTNSDKYVPYRYKGLADQGAPGAAATASYTYPGASRFGPGAHNRYVTQLGRMLVARGGKRFYTSGPGPSWGEADRRATQAFQRAQGWRGSEADGLPGPDTWHLLVSGRGKDIPPAGKPAAHAAPAAATHTGAAAAPAAPATAGKAPAYPGEEYFGPGRSNVYVERLGKQLVKKGFGRYYTRGPGPAWGEADRRATQAFQRAQGWTGSAADGYPGRETWRRLFA
ncbi:peptidoglycan-binding protein [Streptomyces sp. NRRL F-5126]|uniref:peptidoglycan-binding protein n=1 Tax=Streptomyces sp. NRRL F-5126 TaxID=1463857 RepID=UPI0004CAD5D4|nr:peptidoglycan-binding protein [Streptomyces sp. NRRL F-5126]